MLGASIGFFAACLITARTVRRTSVETWKEARIYFTKLYSQPKH